MHIECIETFMSIDEGFEVESAESCDHGSVIGAKFEWRDGEIERFFFAIIFESFSESSVCGDAAGDDDGFSADLFCSADCFSCEGIDDGFEDRSAEVRESLSFGHVSDAPELSGDAGFESAEGEVEIVVLRECARKIVCVWVSADGEFVDVDAAWVGDADHFSDFVEGFAGRVVDGVSDAFILSDAADSNEICVTAGDDESHEWEIGFIHAVSSAE